MTVAITVLFTLLLVTVILNLRAGEKKIVYEVEHLYSVDSIDFLNSVNHLLGPSLLDGNKITTLVNGKQIFPAMLNAIRSAEHTICFETYIYWSGKIGQEFTDALCAKAKNGVAVHLIFDWIGSVKMDSEYTQRLEKAGVQIERFHPPRWYTLARINNRTHRKLLIIDGKTGFTGGVGIADVWLGDAESPQYWRDTHYQLEGPCVAQMQAAFLDNWMKSRANVLHGTKYFPTLESVGNLKAQVFESSAHEGSESIRLMYLLAMSSAVNSIYIQNSYFVPDDLTIETMVSAKQRGVDIQIIVPNKHIDQKLARSASKARWGKLLQSGIKIYEYQPTMFHCKLMVVDNLWTTVGSTNFDSRSFRLNAEANLNVYDKNFAAAQYEIFMQDRKLAREVTYQEWTKRPLLEKMSENIAALLRSQL